MKPEDLMPEGDKSQEDRLERELHGACPICGNEIKVKTENYEWNEGQAGDYQYERGHERNCINFRKEI